jgi:hypothetical protein
MLRGGPRREERLLSRTRVCVDRVGVSDDMSEVLFAGLPPHSHARPAESHKSLGQACPTRSVHADQLG